MKDVAKIGLLDEAGQPFGPEIDAALRSLMPRLQRQFPALNEETTLIEVLEEAGRKIAEHERRVGPIEKLHAYAWVAVRNVATSRMRRGSMRIARATVSGEDAVEALDSMRSSHGTPEQIETDILVEQLLARLTPEERMVCVWKRIGFSSREIAREQGTSVERVNTFFHRVKQKIRDALRTPDVNASSSPAAPRRKARTA